MTRTANNPKTYAPHACAALLLASVVGCGPRDATPMPEPPSLDITKVGGPRETVTASECIGEPDSCPPVIVSISGEPGAATPNTLLRVTNLDTRDPVTAVEVRVDGGFEIVLSVTEAQELRFQVLDGSVRGAPEDVILHNAPLYLEPSLRHECLTLAPGFDVAALSGTASVELHNGCAEPVLLAQPRFRLGLPGFGQPALLPQTLAPGEGTTLVIGVDGAQPSEDVLLLDATLGATTIRYPITIHVDAP